MGGRLREGSREATQRGLFFVITGVGTVLCGVILAVAARPREDRFFNFAGLLVMFLAAAMGPVLMLANAPLSEALVVCTGYGVAAGVLLNDLSSRAVGELSWFSLIIIADFLLVMRVDAKYALWLVSFLVLWLLVMSAEAVLRFGVFDIPGLRPQDGKGGRREHFERMGDCSTLPCKEDVATILSNVLGHCGVFVLDFIATRGFARDVLKEQTRMERTISTVQEIASLLAGYDVEAVAELLKAHEGEMPGGMANALRRLEQNLRVYKAYLPKTCLPHAEMEAESVSVGDHDVSVCTSTSAGSSAAMGLSTRTVPLLLAKAKATLMLVNIKNTLTLVKSDSAHFSRHFTALLAKTLAAVEAKRGMVDVFVGDKIHCSFNTSKKCAAHASSALHAVYLLGFNNLPDFSIGVATGNLHCGDMGCEVMRRFSMVGVLVRDVLGIERAGRAFGCDVLCNRLCFSDAECEHNLRLIPCKVELAEDCEAEVVAELLISVEQGANTMGVTDTLEWMYVVGGKKEWDDYNVAVRQYLKGETHTVLDHTGERAEQLRSSFAKYAPIPQGVLRLNACVKLT